MLDREFFRTHHRLAEFYSEHVTHGWGRLPARILGLVAGRSPHSSRATLETSAGRLHDREEDLQAASAKVGGHLFDAGIELVVHVPRDATDVALDRLRQMAGAFGAFTQSRLGKFHMRRVRRRSRRAAHRLGTLLSHEEVATLFHLPTATVAAERMQTNEFTELEPPPTFCSGAEPGALTLGRVLFRGDTRSVGIDTDARLRHVYIVGSTGTGKSTLLLNLIRQDMKAGHGLTVVDVHGDLADGAMAYVPLAPEKRHHSLRRRRGVPPRSTRWHVRTRAASIR